MQSRWWIRCFSFEIPKNWDNDWFSPYRICLLISYFGTKYIHHQKRGGGWGLGGSNYRLYSCQSEHESKVHRCCEQNSDRWFIFSRVFNPRGFGIIMFIIRYPFYCFVFENDFKFNFVIGGKGGFVIYASSFIMSPVLCHIGLMFFCVFCIRPCSL